MALPILTLDWETYWSADYTLSKMTCEEYVRDPRFKAHMVGLKTNDRPSIVIPPEQIPAVFARIPWDKVILLGQNTQFDAFILAHHYNIVPRFYLDTMSMSRALFPHKRASLEVIAENLDLTKRKGGASRYSVTNTKGIRTLDPQQWRDCAFYCADDCDLTWEAWCKMKPFFPMEELQIIDQTLRCFTQPVLRLNPDPLKAEVDFEVAKKQELVKRLGGDPEAVRKVLSSGPKFAALLESLSVMVPVKPSPAALKKDPDLREILDELEMPEEAYTPALLTEAGIPWSYAFGKNDKGMQALQQHDDPLVVAAVEARLAVKSTLGQTRAARLLSASARGPYPVSLNYAAAHTLRDGGSGGCNVQNLPGNKPGQSTRLRESFEAPEGYLLPVCDLSAIECRGLAYLAGEESILEVFRAGGDIYCEMASSVYQKRVTKVDKPERKTGKDLILSCGYSMSWKRFQNNMYLVHKTLFGRDMADMLGVSVDATLHRHNRYVTLAKPQTLTPEEFAIHCAVSEFLVKAYRDKYPAVTRFWKTCIGALDYMVEGHEFALDPHGVITTFKTGFKAPWGLPLTYVDLQAKPKKRGRGVSWSRASKEGRSHLHPGLVAENCLTTDTIILTGCGPKRIVDVADDDLVFDGVEFVAHEGLLERGEREVLDFGGVGITPEHLVEVDGEWVEARSTTWQEATSSCERHYGSALRCANCDPLPGWGRAELYMACPLRLRGGEGVACFRVQEGEDEVMRVPEGGVAGAEPRFARHEPAPSVRSVAQHVRSLQATHAQGVEELRRAGDNDVSAVAGELRGLLGGHGADISEGTLAGAERQQPRLHPGELRVGGSLRAGTEPSDERESGHPARILDPVGGVREVGAQHDDALLPRSQRVAEGTLAGPAGARVEKTYDLKNCGPRHKFCVYVPEAQGWMVVHNCVQWLCRHIMMYQALKLQGEGLKVAFRCHDEIVGCCRAEDAPYWERRMEEVMSEPIPWLPGFPLAAEAHTGKTYLEAK